MKGIFWQFFSGCHFFEMVLKFILFPWHIIPYIKSVAGIISNNRAAIFQYSDYLPPSWACLSQSVWHHLVRRVGLSLNDSVSITAALWLLWMLSIWLKSLQFRLFIVFNSAHFDVLLKYKHTDKWLFITTHKAAPNCRITVIAR